MVEVGLLRDVLLLVSVLRPCRLLQRDRLVLLHGRVAHHHAAALSDRPVLVVGHVGVHVLQVVERGSVGQAEDGDADVESDESQLLDDVSGHHRADGVCRAVRDVGDGVDGSVDRDVLLVDDEAEHREKGRVD